MLIPPSQILAGLRGQQMAAGSLVLMAHICVFSEAAMLPTEVAAQERATLCDGFSYGGYGPFDYRTQRDKLPIVEVHHFTPEVENLIRGKESSIGGDLSYTLDKFPNHHRALVAMMRLAERMKTPQPQGAKYAVECYFDRALRFAPDDTVARTLYATFLAKSNREADAAAQLERATHDAGDNPFTHYNIGLVYVDLKHYDKALRQAHRAMALGFRKPDLMNTLKQAGQWKEPSADALVAAPSASVPSAGTD